MERSVKRLMEDREKRREENIGKYIEQLCDESTPYRLRAAEALEFPVLDDSEKLRLQFQGRLTNLIEKKWFPRGPVQSGRSAVPSNR